MTPHALILVPLGIFLLFFSRKWLYRFFIFSLAFSATAIFNVGSGDNASGVQVWMFFGCLWLLRDISSRLARGDLSVRRSLTVPVSCLAAFLLILTLSLIMPIYIDGRLLIPSPSLRQNFASPLYFSTRHFTSWLYVVFGSLITVSIAQENSTLEKLTETARIYLSSGFFIALWGFFQVACSLLHLQYSASLFNNSATPSATGYGALIVEAGVSRMSSVAVEASVLSEVLLTIIPLTLPAVLNCGFIVSRRFDRVCFALLALALIVSTSSTGYLGLSGFLC